MKDNKKVIEVIKFMEENSRDIIPKEKAYEILSVFSDYGLIPKTIGNEPRVDWFQPNKKGEGVAVYKLTISICYALKIEPLTKTRFLGVGKNAKAITLNNLLRIIDKLGIDYKLKIRS